MDLNFNGLLLAVCTFLIIGICHPIVIKTEYYFGTRPWIVFLLIGLGCLVAALFIGSLFWSAVCGVTGASFLWAIGELFDQKKRVEKGWFPMNPKRKDAYEGRENRTNRHGQVHPTRQNTGGRVNPIRYPWSAYRPPPAPCGWPR